jgi:glycopeptide antibiotics resistance protein
VDALVNLAGFIPLGFFLAMFFRIPGSTAGLRAFALVLAIGALLSLFIEANQTFLVTRNSSMTDLILNSLGAMAGALLLTASSRN